MEQKIGIGERIRSERDRLGFSQPAFAALGDASKNSQLSWEKEVAYPNAAVLAAWAKVGADVSFILSGKTSASALSPEEEVLFDFYRRASPEVRRAALGALVGAQSIAPTPPLKMTNKAPGGVQIGQVTGKARVITKKG